MKTLKIALLAGTLAFASSMAVAQTIAPNYGVDETAARAAVETGSGAYASAQQRVPVRKSLRVQRPAIQHGTDSDAGAK